jgi:hypothetical protein
MIPPYTYVAARQAEERMNDTMRDGEHARLMRRATPVRCGPMNRILARIGDLLVSGGQKLQARHRPARAGLNDKALRVSQ